jgi:hypothetical protein
VIAHAVPHWEQGAQLAMTERWWWLLVGQVHCLERGALAGERMEAITKFFQFLAPLLEPLFFYNDKDLGQIASVKEAFPNATVTLCYFHVLQLVQRSIKWDKYSYVCWENYLKCCPSSDRFPFMTGGLPTIQASSGRQRIN